MANSSTATVIKFRPPSRRPGFGGPPPGGSDEQREPIISNGRLAVLMLIASESMLFSGLIGSFLVYKLGAPFWPPPALPRLPLTLTWINTFVLLASAVTMAMSVRAVRRVRGRRFVALIGITLALGVTFLSVQGSEWVRLIAHGLRISSGTYGATFYTLIGCHGLHVMGAVLWLAWIFYGAWIGRYNSRNRAALEACAIYWYFVCAIWPVLFVLVYL
jgi:heme/copper-type cytochrome/quinol oxidase subunit 3